MKSALYFHVYRCDAALFRAYREQLIPEFDAQLFKSSLKESIQASFSFSDEVFPEEMPLLVRFFHPSAFAQHFVVVPLENGVRGENESADEYGKRLYAQAADTLKQWFGTEYAADKFTLVTALIWLPTQTDEFGRSEVLHKAISRFLRGSDAISDEHFHPLDSIEYVMDGNGLGVSSRAVYPLRAKRMLLLLMLARAYLGALETIVDNAARILLQSSKHTQEEALLIENTLEELTRFLVQYYFDDPVLPRNNESFLLYDVIKKRQHLTHQYHDAVEQLRLLGEIARLHRYESLTAARHTEQQAQRELHAAREARDRRYTLLFGILGVVIALLQLILVFKG